MIDDGAYPWEDYAAGMAACADRRGITIEAQAGEIERLKTTAQDLAIEIVRLTAMIEVAAGDIDKALVFCWCVSRDPVAKIAGGLLAALADGPEAAP